jgi:hypothetical protein
VTIVMVMAVMFLLVAALRQCSNNGGGGGGWSKKEKLAESAVTGDGPGAIDGRGPEVPEGPERRLCT